MRRMSPFHLLVFTVTLLVIGALFWGSSIYKQYAHSEDLPPPSKAPQTVQTLFTDLSDTEIQTGNFPRYSPDGLPGEHLRIARLDWKMVSDALKDLTRVCLPLVSPMDCREFFPVNPPIPVQKFNGPEGNTARLSWIGRVNGDASSEAIFIIRERNQAISGTIRYQGHIYDIRPVGRATISIVEVNPKLYVPDKSPRIASPGKSPEKRLSSPPPRIIPQVDTLTLSRSSATQIQTGQKIQIGVMVVYTKQVKAALEASCDLCLITDKILEAVEQANSSLGTNRQREFHLVYVNEVDYAQNGVSTDLSFLQAKGEQGRILDQIHQWRYDNKADVVSLWVEYDDSEPCGESYSPIQWESSGTWSYTNHPENWAFSVVRRSCAVNFLTFHHEVGHVMGADHDRVNVAKRGGPPPTGYGYGYVNVGSHKATIMGIPDDPAWFVNMWSSPSHSFPNGSPAGTRTNDNFRVLNETAALVSSFGDRLSVDNSAPAMPSNLRTN